MHSRTLTVHRQTTSCFVLDEQKLFKDLLLAPESQHKEISFGE